MGSQETQTMVIVAKLLMVCGGRAAREYAGLDEAFN